MKTKELNVPPQIISEVAALIGGHDITNEILGTTDEGEVIVSVEYETEERPNIYEIMEMIDDASEEEEDQD